MNRKIILSALTALLTLSSVCSCAGSNDSTGSSEKSSETVTGTTTVSETTTTPVTTAAPAPEPAFKFDPEATETVIEISSPDTREWVNPMGEDYLDARSMPDDTELTFTVELALTEETVNKADSSHQIAFAPCYSDSGEKIAAEPQMLYGDMPVGANMLHTNLSDGTYTLLKDPETGELSEDIYRLSDKSIMADVFVKVDGFIKLSPEVWKKWKAGEAHTVSFTLTREALAQMKQGSKAGMLLQCSGGFELRRITINCGNILTHEQYIRWQETASAGEKWRNS